MNIQSLQVVNETGLPIIVDGASGPDAVYSLTLRLLEKPGACSCLSVQQDLDEAIVILSAALPYLDAHAAMTSSDMGGLGGDIGDRVIADRARALLARIDGKE